MDLQETIQFTRIVDNLGRLWPKLTGMAATEAVNFSKERFVAQVDIFNVPFAKRKPSWITRARDKGKKAGRAILVDTARLKRDVQKIYVGTDRSIVGTSRLTVPYAKANNEGFKGTVQQTVKAHQRRRYGKEKRGTGVYNVKTRKEGKKTVKVQTGTIQVRTFKRTIKQNITQRQFLGASPLLDARIDYMLLAQITKAINDANK